MEEQNNYYVYRFKDKQDNIVYVGRTHNLNKRFKQHAHLTENISTIEYIECINETDMVIKEIYYINLYFNENTTNKKDVYGTQIDYGFTDQWKKLKITEHDKDKVTTQKRQREIKTIFNTPDYMKWSVIKLHIYSPGLLTEAYVSHYDKDINKLKYSTYLYEAELFSNKAAYHIVERLNNQIYLETESEIIETKDKEELELMEFETKYGYCVWDDRPYFSFTKFEYDFDKIQQSIFEKYIKDNNIDFKDLECT